MSEKILSFGIIVLVSLIMIGIGIAQIKSKNPVGFYSGEKPPKKEDISDVIMWNRKHGIMWTLYGVAMIGSDLIGLIIQNEVFSFIILMIAIVGALPIMIFYHHYLVRKYLKS